MSGAAIHALVCAFHISVAMFALFNELPVLAIITAAGAGYHWRSCLALL